MTETAPVISARNFKTLLWDLLVKVAPKTELQIRDFNGAVLTHVKVDGSVEGKRGLKVSCMFVVRRL